MAEMIELTDLQIWEPWVMTDEETLSGDIPIGRAIKVGDKMCHSQAVKVASDEMEKRQNVIAMMVRRTTK